MKKIICFLFGHSIIYNYSCNLGNSILVSIINGVEKHQVIGTTIEKCKRCGYEKVV